MNKILKPYTIVPSNLYVERSADRQVKNILEDMGRPGYVLVSRQMGKTNLLINARRKYSNDDDRFIYIDLSNLFDNETQCFRNIIDTAIETNLDVFSQLEIDVREYRKANSDLPPHKQHEKELRMLLKSIKGKLIIILDEIDALTKVEYSDRIFAQIRSVYFARTNYNEFDRLTYLLSGVVEPSELIKDPKISPFNIGEKIFLNDFTRSEFDSFLHKAELSFLAEKIKTRIFYWTNGNPRLTWDICCIIEDQSAVIDSELDIDSIIKVHYLTAFDKPPVDNIREIVKKDSAIQDALIEIEYGKGDVISDNIKQKLYLGGIINYTENDVEIKNRIIKESLSSQWISSIRGSEVNLLEKGIDFYNEGIFKRAISALKAYLTQENRTIEKNEDFNVSNFYLGLSYYYENKFDDALKYLLTVDFDPKQHGNFFYKTELFKGYIFQNTKRIPEAQEAFEKIVRGGSNDENYLSAKINLGLLLSLKIKSVLEKQRSKELLLEIANSQLQDYKKISDSLFIESRTVALFFLADLEKNAEDFRSTKLLTEALSISPIKFKPAILFNLYRKEVTALKQADYIDAIVSIIFDNDLTATKDVEFTNIKFTYKLLREIQLEVFKVEKYAVFNDLVQFESTRMSRYSDSLIILEKLVGFAQELDYPIDLIYKLSEYLYKKCTDDKSEVFYNVLKLLASINIDFTYNYQVEYMRFLDQVYTKSIDLDDITIYLNLSQNLLNLKDFKTIIEIINIGERLKLKLSDELKTTILLIDIIKMKSKIEFGQIEQAKSIASNIIYQVKTFEEQYLRDTLIRQIGIQNITIQCQNILSIVHRDVPIYNNKKIGRNDMVKVRYENNSEIIAKYKKIESDLKSGKCKLII
ncbi:tol-pal system YbgF family protein [Flavobacterium sp. 14A]|uniref:tetratricopeptide repeat protein n=1 Tax=Flavobacterium sp. 14A TaxID=2735896 RepID=UPI0015703C8A|nr:AAA-like domain-containing protein [Flavobacterium sp. 14A]NRT11286.1 DNA polymerase III delta prime subunit [Flavobacterium sp. 14A]